MRIAIFENIMTPGGHEVEFDRILVEELRGLGHAVEFYVPQNFSFQFDYQTPVTRLKGDAVTYTNSRGLKKIFAAAKREINRQRWYSQLFEAQKNFDALIVPTSTYRYLRALNHSALKKISVPLIFILHGINPTEAPKFLAAADKLSANKNIKPVVLTFGDNIFGERRENIFTIYPPTYTARDLKVAPEISAAGKILKVGFFGQYRREKNLRGLLEVYLRGNYTRKVELQVQGSTMHAEDAEDFEKIIEQYRGVEGLSFLHKGLIGAEWQRAILNVDALLMPYSAPRYRYHWGGMLFTAIGFGKPVVASDDMNPEVFELYRVGETFHSGDTDDLARVLENFINGFDENFPTYSKNLKAAGEDFSPVNFARRLEKIIQQ
ncbi:MAG: glycosyltransferase [Quinella sp. 3Q1]|nr:glycosyltransferase [Quinella sp. 3Q1]MBR6887321.1 glycosyltransferase [Selenomonadaceae bacterium]